MSRMFYSPKHKRTNVTWHFCTHQMSLRTFGGLRLRPAEDHQSETPAGRSTPPLLSQFPWRCIWRLWSLKSSLPPANKSPCPLFPVREGPGQSLDGSQFNQSAVIWWDLPSPAGFLGTPGHNLRSPPAGRKHWSCTGSSGLEIQDTTTGS